MSPQAGWLLQAEVVPRLRASIPRNVHCVGSEDAEELIQDSIAIAAKMLHSAELAGKTVTAGNIAYYALQLIRSKVRLTGERTSGTSSAVACHAESERLLVPLGRRGNQVNSQKEVAPVGSALSVEYENWGILLIFQSRLEFASTARLQILFVWGIPFQKCSDRPTKSAIFSAKTAWNVLCRLQIFGKKRAFFLKIIWR